MSQPNWRHLERLHQSSYPRASKEQAEKELSTALSQLPESKPDAKPVEQVPRGKYSKVLTELAGETIGRQAAAIKQLSPNTIDHLIQALQEHKKASYEKALDRAVNLAKSLGLTCKDLEALR